MTSELATQMKPVTHARSSGRLPIRVRGRSHTALALAPERPIAAWLADLDALLQRSPAAFSGHLALLNVSGLSLSGPDLTALVMPFDINAPCPAKLHRGLGGP